MTECTTAPHNWIDHVISRSGAQLPEKRICLDCGKEERYRYYRTLREANAARQEEWDAGGKLPLSFRFCELAGEVGEACNVLKKLEREQLGIAGSRATSFQLMEELADVAICVDIILMFSNIDPIQYWANEESDYGLTEIGCRMAFRAGRACDLLAPPDSVNLELRQLMLHVRMASYKFKGNLFSSVVDKFNATSAKVGLLTRMGEQP